jgi:hypothetical protein
MPEKPAAVKPVVTDQEANMIISRYMESLKGKRGGEGEMGKKGEK